MEERCFTVLRNVNVLLIQAEQKKEEVEESHTLKGWMMIDHGHDDDGKEAHEGRRKRTYNEHIHGSNHMARMRDMVSLSWKLSER